MLISKEQKITNSEVMKLAWPSIFESISVSMVEYIDTAMVGSIGSAATAAVAVNTAPIWMLNASITAIAIGGTVLVAHSYGANKKEHAAEVSRQVFVMGIIFSIIVSACMFAISGSLPIWLGADEHIVPDAAFYMRTISLCLVPHFTGLVLAGVMRGAGDTKIPMRVNILTNVLNVIGNFFLIFPTRTVEILGSSFTIVGAGMGVRGAGISSAVSMSISGIIMILIFFFRNFDVRLNLKGFSFRKDILMKVGQIGIPTAMERLVTTTGLMIFAKIVAELGTVQLAAHHLANTAESISYMPAIGFQVAATTLVGQSIGSGDSKKAKKYGETAFTICTLCLICISIFTFTFAKPLIGIFTPEAEVIEIGSVLLRIVAFADPLYGASLVFTGALMGTGNTKWPFLICLIGMWGIRLSFALFFIHVLKLGVQGAWIAMFIDLSFRGIMMGIRFYRLKWDRFEKAM